MFKKRDRNLDALLRYKKKEQRQQFCKLRHIQVIGLSCVITTLLFILSYAMRRQHPWFAPLLQSLGVGMVTGMVLYILGNIRNGTEKYLEHIYNQLQNLHDLEEKIYFSYPLRMFWTVQSFSNVNECDMAHEYLEEVVTASKDYLAALKTIDYQVYTEFQKTTSTAFDDLEKSLDNVVFSIPEDLTMEAGEDIKDRIVAILEQTMEWFEVKFRNVEIQIGQIKKYPF